MDDERSAGLHLHCIAANQSEPQEGLKGSSESRVDGSSMTVSVDQIDASLLCVIVSSQKTVSRALILWASFCHQMLRYFRAIISSRRLSVEN